MIELFYKYIIAAILLCVTSEKIVSTHMLYGNPAFAMFRQIQRLDTVSKQAQFAINTVVVPANMNFVILSKPVSSGPSSKLNSMSSSDRSNPTLNNRSFQLAHIDGNLFLMPMYKQSAKQEFHYEPCYVSKKSFAFDGGKFGEMIGGSFSNCVSFNMSEEELGEQRMNSQSSSS